MASGPIAPVVNAGAKGPRGAKREVNEGEDHEKRPLGCGLLRAKGCGKKEGAVFEALI